MCEHAVPELGRVAVRGTPRQIGFALGEAGRAAVHDVLLQSDYWKAVTDTALAGAVYRMSESIRALFPWIWEEIVGLAEGVNLPLEQVAAWNCRGDLMSNVPDGCSTVQLPGPEPVIAHNEDGLSGFRGHAFIADITPDNGAAVMAFCYPGSLPGHTFALTGAGLVQTVNNLRLRGVSADIPRMVVARAVLRSETLDETLDLLKRHNTTGGFHLTLACRGDTRLIGVEFGGGICVPRVLEEPAFHANHALYLTPGGTDQLITRSSNDRQKRGMKLVLDGARTPKDILRDTGGPGLPIHRTAQDDPDCENTLATAVFRVGNTAVDWSIYDQRSKRPVFAGYSPGP